MLPPILWLTRIEIVEHWTVFQFKWAEGICGESLCHKFDLTIWNKWFRDRGLHISDVPQLDNSKGILLLESI